MTMNLNTLEPEVLPRESHFGGAPLYRRYFVVGKVVKNPLAVVVISLLALPAFVLFLMFFAVLSIVGILMGMLSVRLRQWRR